MIAAGQLPRGPVLPPQRGPDPARRRCASGTGDIEPLARAASSRQAVEEGLPRAPAARSRPRRCSRRQPWRGNVRELRNFVFRAGAAVARGGDRRSERSRQLLADRPGAERGPPGRRLRRGARRLARAARSPPPATLYHGALAAFEKPAVRARACAKPAATSCARPSCSGSTATRCASGSTTSRSTPRRFARRGMSRVGSPKKPLQFCNRGVVTVQRWPRPPAPMQCPRHSRRSPRWWRRMMVGRAPGQPLRVAGNRRRGSARGDAGQRPTSR